MANDQTVKTEIMSTNTAVAIFVKTPSLSPVKTRLATGIGDESALTFYLLSLNAVQETVKSLNSSPFWAVAEENGLDDLLWQDFPSIYTGEGNLGQRQHHIYETLLQNHDHVLLIGADAPQLSQALLEDAIVALNTHDFVIGPARDGGYYLFGGRLSTQQEMWTTVPWSTNITLERLEAALSSTPFHLPFLTDVDTKDDLENIENEMPKVINKAQKRLIDWIKS